MASSSYSQPETGRIQFQITPLKYFLWLHAKENLSTPLVAEFTVVPFTAGPDRTIIWSLANFSAVATDARGIVGETVRNIIRCRTRKVGPAVGLDDPIARQNFSNKVFSNVQNGLHQYGLELRSVRVVETKTDTIETKPDAVEAETDAIDIEPEAVEIKPDAVKDKTDAVETKPEIVEIEPDAVEAKTGAVKTKPEIYGTVDSRTPELETDGDLEPETDDDLEPETDDDLEPETDGDLFLVLQNTIKDSDRH